MKWKIASFTLILLFVAACFVSTTAAKKASCEEVSLPITSRSFLLGVTPTYKLNGTLEEPFITAGSVAEVMNLWFSDAPWYNTTAHLNKTFLFFGTAFSQGR